LTDTIAAIWLHTGTAWGAAASTELSARTRRTRNGEPDVRQLLDGNHRIDGFAHQREYLPQAGMEQHRRVIDDEVLVEIEVPDAAGQRDGGIDSIDAVGNFMDVGAGLGIGDHGVLRGVSDEGV
jgi:hypothetical protein